MGAVLLKDTPFNLLNTIQREFHNLYPFPCAAEICLLKVSENHTFLVNCGRKRYIFRVNRPSYHTKEELAAELQWMDSIRRDSPIIIPEVIAGSDGHFLQSFVSPVSGTKYYCSLFSFLPGQMVRSLQGSELIHNIEEIGAVAASLHNQVQNDPGSRALCRFSWDIESLLGEGARWGSWRSYPGLTPEDVALFDSATKIITNRLAVYGKSPDRYGLIHSDLHLSNVIVHEGRLQIIDFDDCGFSWFLYDLGCSLVEYTDNLGALTEAWLRGYQSARPLTEADLAEVPTFILLRRIIRFAWLSSHAESDTAKTVGPEYLAKTRRMAQAYIR